MTPGFILMGFDYNPTLERAPDLGAVGRKSR
jgi:hypothetical protein